jgi:hypothetical protein
MVVAPAVELYDMGTGLMSKLQRVQNNLTRIVGDAPGRSRDQRSSQELLREFHWLPVADRINFKIALLYFKAHRLQDPHYLYTLN